ncbi:hypothetical protein [Mesorhizobium sp. BE184]|uniref:hypothetical protein n=1 Tax=Mesorhizobium sp. BE184 TaxID=2817714 RepID=UPI002864C8D9|nr:hypothetical protein [Mesorhizobium sp. BE184]MDR7032926.1 hypothetical protein [Mesorhizobium sp. BE184]
MPNNYTTGTVSVSNGSAVVAGTGTGWAVALVAGGMFSCGGIAVPIASVESDTSMTLAYPWPAPNGAGLAYAIARETSEAVRAAWTNDRLAQILNKLSLSAIHPDGAGTLAERNALNPVPATGYLWLRVEPGQPLEIYKKSASGWDGPFALSGASGSAGSPGTPGISAGLPYTFSSSVTIGDPGVGKIRFNSATPSAVTAIMLDDQSSTAGFPFVAGFVNSWARGILTVVKVGSPQVFAIYDTIGVIDAAGFTQLDVTHQASAGAFLEGDPVQAQWSMVDAAALATKAAVANVQVFNSNGTWTKPAGAKTVDVIVWGAGGGGGGGPKVAAATPSSGGAGGGGGSRGFETYLASALPATVACSIGAGGAGGAGATVLGDGGNGAAGGNTFFGPSVSSYVAAYSGGGGGGGGSGRGSGGGGGAGRTQPGGSASGSTAGTPGIAGGIAGSTVGTAAPQINDNGGAGGGAGASNGSIGNGGSAVAGNGGGAGGGFNTANAGVAGGASIAGYSTGFQNNTNTGGAANGGNGGAGGGGGSYAAGNGGNGGAGTYPGQGGGGGGASQAGIGGNGGNGNSGLIIVITYF